MTFELASTPEEEAAGVVWDLVPAPGRVAVEVFNDVEERIIGAGLIVPPQRHPMGPKPTVGKVYAVCKPYTNDGEEYDAIFPVGVWVLFGQYTGSEISLNNRKFIVLRENDVVATVRSADEAKAPPIKVNARA